LEEKKGDKKESECENVVVNKELKKKKEAWNDIDHAYKKALKSISKVEGLEG